MFKKGSFCRSKVWIRNSHLNNALKNKNLCGPTGTSSTEKNNISQISTSLPRPEDLEKTNDLEKVLFKYDLFESDEELAHRIEVLTKVNELVKQWIKGINIKKNMSPKVAENVGGKIYTFGSYRLGVHTKGADIDVLCIAPRHVDRSEFFSSFVELLKYQKEVKDLQSIEEAYVPIIKMTFDGIKLDILFARLALKDIPENQDLHDVSLLKNLDQRCVRSLNGSRVTEEIIHLVPNIESFKLALHAIKLWAKKQGIYSNKLGYLGGVSWAILVARACQLYPNACAATLVHKFFLVFSQWTWPKPVLLKQPEENHFGFYVWDPKINERDRFHLMPIITPAYPHQNSAFNVSFSTRTVMQESFKNGLTVVDEIMSNKSNWDKLFEPVNFFTLYRHYIALMATSPTKKNHLEWYGLVESKVRILVAHLEKNSRINIAHVNPDTFTPIDPEPDTCQSMWFLGLQLTTTNGSLDLTHDVEQFINTISKQARVRKAYMEGIKIDVKYVRRKDLSKYLDCNILGKSNKENVLNDCCSSNKKRPLDEDSQDGNSKRRSIH